MSRKVAVIGAGSMGTAVSILLSKNGHQVTMWTPFREEAEMMNTLREHIHKLPGVMLPEGILCTDCLEQAARDAETIVLVVPSQTVRENAARLAPYIKEGMVVSCFSKGLEEKTGLRMSQVVAQELPGTAYVALSGPCHAEELARDIPSAYVAASENREAAEYVQDLLMTPKFRIYTNSDIIGVELGGAIKNVIALCAGISDGLGFGDNTKAALMTRGITEIARLGNAMGAQRQTFAGLAGIGDLIVTCTSMHSRNRRAGILIGQGKSVEGAIAEVKMVVEGFITTKAAFKLAMENDVVMPITTEAYRILFENKNPRAAVAELMTREKTHEMEEISLNGAW